MHFRDSQASSQSTQQKLHWEEKLAGPREKMIEMKTRKAGKVAGLGTAARAAGALWSCLSWLRDAQGFSLLLSKDQSLYESSGLGWSKDSCKDFYSAQEASLDLREKPLSEEEFNSVKKCRDVLRFKHIFVALIKKFLEILLLRD